MTASIDSAPASATVAESVTPEEPRPAHCELGGTAGCDAAAQLKVADSWGDSAWGCWEHAEDALRQVPSVFLAEAPAHGLRQYRARRTLGS